MSDITKSNADAGQIHFSANNTQADLWMRKHYHYPDIDLHLEEAKEFQDAAQAAGFTVSSF